MRQRLSSEVPDRAPLEDIGRGQTGSEWTAWRRRTLPGYFTSPDADHHRRLWRWAWSLRAGERNRPYVAIWPRLGGKSTVIEAVACAVGARGTRNYVLYVSGTQDQADDHVSTARRMLEKPAMQRAHPTLTQRLEGVHGHSQGWRRERFRTASGLTVDALGLDSAARGKKLDEVRPDLIILDDLDEEQDGPHITKKKIKLLTRKILGTRAKFGSVLAVQNLVKKNGIFGRLAGTCEEGLEADFLQDRIVDGPHKSIEGLETERQYSEKLGRYTNVITAGTPVWEGFDLEDAQAAINDLGITAFRKEHQHRVEEGGGGMYDGYEFVRVGLLETPDFDRVVVWVDPAVENHDGTDSYAIQVDALGEDGKIYRLYSWEDSPRQDVAGEEIATGPEKAVKRALVKAFEWGAQGVGIETDQGGSTWKSVMRQAWQELTEDDAHPEITEATKRPEFRDAKVSRLQDEHTGKSGKSKAGRSQKMLRAYERDEIRHVKGTHRVLERALNRAFVTKPFDLADAAFWGWFDLSNPPAKAEVIFG